MPFFQSDSFSSLLVQLAATSWSSSSESSGNRSVFHPVAPPGKKFTYIEMKSIVSLELNSSILGLTGYLDNYKMSTSLLQTLNMTRYHTNSFKGG